MQYKIKQIRAQLRMTQQELAEKSGVSRATIAALESGVAKNTTSRTLVCLAEALGVGVEQLFFTANA